MVLNMNYSDLNLSTESVISFPDYFYIMGKEKKNPIKVVEKLRIRKKGTFNYKAIHNSIHDFLLKMGYNFAETKHVEKKGDSGMDVESEWSASRKVSGYVKFIIGISVLVKDYKEIAVEEGGKKVKTGIGRIEIVFNSSMDKNYGKMFSERKGEFTNLLKELYEKYIVSKRLSDYEDKLKDETHALYEDLKGLTE